MDIQNDNPTPLIVLREIIIEKEALCSDTTSAAEISSFMVSVMIGGGNNFSLLDYNSEVANLNIRTDGIHGISREHETQRRSSMTLCVLSFLAKQIARSATHFSEIDSHSRLSGLSYRTVSFYLFRCHCYASRMDHFDVSGPSYTQWNTF